MNIIYKLLILIWRINCIYFRWLGI